MKASHKLYFFTISVCSQSPIPFLPLPHATKPIKQEKQSKLKANFSLIYTVGACSSFTRELFYSCSTEGKSRGLVHAWAAYLCEAPSDFLCSFVISSLNRIKFLSYPSTPEGLLHHVFKQFSTNFYIYLFGAGKINLYYFLT